jgi:GntR family transcriptional repressor for pyruvate dehydrogenase complex
MAHGETKAEPGLMRGGGQPEGSRRGMKTAELVALDIVRDIVGQQLKPGDRLPLEAEMLAHYRVSRSSLREALRLLETQGLIMIRPGPGAGTVVSEASPRSLGRTMTLYFHLADVSYDELLRTWVVTEPLLAELAAGNPDKERRVALMSPFLPSEKPDETMSISTGLSFHDAVAELADNKALSIMFRAIGFIVSDHMLVHKERTALEPFIIREHEELARAIILGNAKKAGKLMREHVEHVSDDFKAYWPRKVGERVLWR